MKQSALEIEELVPAGALAQLTEYVALLDRWRKVTNLISESSFEDVWTRHVLDSVLLQKSFATYRQWLDFGSGAGFPGLVLGVMLSGTVGAQVHCVESDGRKCAFLRAVSQKLRIPVKVHNKRVEHISLAETGEVEALTARAFASVSKILELGEQYLCAGAVLILPRGKTAHAEVEELDRTRYTLNVHANPASEGGVFFEIRARDRGL